MIPFTPMDNYTSERYSMLFMEWFLADPREAIYALDGKSLKWKTLPDLVTPDGETSVPVRHVVYQCLQESNVDQTLITSFGFSHGRKNEIVNNMEQIKQIEALDSLEQAIIIRHYEPNLYEPQNPYIVSESYKGIYHYAKPITSNAFTTKESVHQIINDIPILHKKMELLNRTIKVLNDLGFQRLFRKDIFAIFNNVGRAEFILPSALDRGPWMAEGMSENVDEAGSTKLYEVYIGKTIKEQDMSANYIKDALIKANLFLDEQSSLRDFDIRKAPSYVDGRSLLLDGSISPLIRGNLIGQVFPSIKFNDTMLFLNTVAFLRGELSAFNYSDIIEHSSIIKKENIEKFWALRGMVDEFISRKFEFSKKQFNPTHQEEIFLLEKRKSMSDTIPRIMDKKKLMSIEQRTPAKSKTFKRKILNFKQ